VLVLGASVRFRFSDALNYFQTEILAELALGVPLLGSDSARCNKDA